MSKQGAPILQNPIAWTSRWLSNWWIGNPLGRKLGHIFAAILSLVTLWFIVRFLIALPGHLSRTGLGSELGGPLIGATGTLLAVGIAIYIFGARRALIRYPALPRKFLVSVSMVLFLVLVLCSVSASIGAVVAEGEDWLLVPAQWLSLSLSTFALSIVAILPTARDAATAGSIRRYAKATLARMDPEEADAYLHNRHGNTLEEYLERTAESPYRVIPHLLRNHLQARDDGFVQRLIVSTVMRTGQLLREAESSRERSFVTGAWLRLYHDFVLICDEEGRQEVLRPSVEFVGELLTHHIETDESWRSMLSLERELRNLCGAMGRVQQAQGAPVRLATEIQNVQVEHLRVGAPTEDQLWMFNQDVRDELSREQRSNLSNQWDKLARSYVRALRELGESAVEAGNLGLARSVVDSMAQLCRRVLGLDNLGSGQKERYLTWTLSAARSLAQDRARELGKGMYRACGTQWKILVDQTLPEDSEYRHVPIVMYTSVMLDLLSDGIAPWGDWNEFRVFILQHGDNQDENSKDGLHWAAATAEDALQTLKGLHDQNQLIAGPFSRVAEVVNGVYPIVVGTHSNDEKLRERYEDLKEEMRSLDDEVGGITKTNLEWPGRPGMTETENLIQGGDD